jgi:hypothetical protein
MMSKSTDIIRQNKVFSWIALATAAILTIPLIAMQFSDEWDWKLSDFVIMAVLLFGTGFTFVHVARVTPKKYRTVIGIVFFVALLYVWAELAVGVFTNIGS